VLGLSTPDEGEVRIFGQSPREAVAGGAIGAMLQEGGIVEDASIRELVTMFAGAHRSPLAVDTVLTAMDIADIADRRGKLSGGQRQRLRLAIALVSNPRLLLLDEPTAAMDVGSRHTFWAFMREFTGVDRTVVFATHYLEEAEEFADRVVLVQDGVIIADGSVAEIRSVVAGRTLTAVVPGAALAALTALPGVVTGEARGERFELVCSDSDEAARALFASFPTARDVEIGAIGLEQAFLALTAKSTTSAKAAA
jgi:ABC-2 type transport system ATP-binding protein